MKRVERWILTLVLVHALLLLGSQTIISFSEFHMSINPVFQYLGVFEEQENDITKTIDHILENVVPF